MDSVAVCDRAGAAGRPLDDRSEASASRTTDSSSSKGSGARAPDSGFAPGTSACLVADDAAASTSGERGADAAGSAPVGGDGPSVPAARAAGCVCVVCEPGADPRGAGEPVAGGAPVSVARPADETEPARGAGGRRDRRSAPGPGAPSANVAVSASCASGENAISPSSGASDIARVSARPNTVSAAASGAANAAAAARSGRTARRSASRSAGGRTGSLTQQPQVQQHLSERQLPHLLRRPPEAFREQERRARQWGVDGFEQLLHRRRDAAHLVDPVQQNL